MFLSKRKRVYANEEEPSKKKKKMQDTITCAKCNQQESLSEIGLTEFPTQWHFVCTDCLTDDIYFIARYSDENEIEE